MKMLYHPKKVFDNVYYSVRKIHPGYKGYCVKVRRSSDNTTQDIGFVDDIIDTDSLQSFIGTDSGYIQVWYDQGGRSNNLEQTEYSLQPYIILNGSIITENGIPAIYWNGGQYMLSQNNVNNGNIKVSIIVLGRLYEYNIGGQWSRFICGYPDCYFFVGTNNGSRLINSFYGNYSTWGSILNNTTKYWINKLRIVTAINNGRTVDNSKIYVDGLKQSTLTDPMEKYNDKIIVGGMYMSSYPNYNTIMTVQCWKGTMSEIQVHSRDLTNLRTSIESKIASVFNVALFPNKPNTAQDFLYITGITDETVSGAINTLIEDLMNAEIWNKMLAIYPFVGGTSDTHKYNLIDPRDEDLAFRLTFGGGLAHGNTGVTPNGSTGYADTHIIPSANLDFDTHISYYSRTSGAAAGAKREMGGDNLNAIVIRYTGDKFYTTLGGISWPSVTNTTTQGYFIVSKTVPGKLSAWRGSTKIMNEVACDDGTGGNKSIYLFGMNYRASPPFEPTTKECAFATIGFGLTDAEASALNTAVQTFQTTLGRNV